MCRVACCFSHTICDRTWTSGAASARLRPPLARGAAGAAWRRAACLCRLSLGRGSCGTCCHHRVPSHQSPVLSECLCLACAPCAWRVYFTRAAAVRSSARPVSRSVRLMLFRGAASTIVTRSLHSRVCRLARISCLAGSGRVHGGRVRCRRSRVGGRARGREPRPRLLSFTSLVPDRLFELGSRAWADFG